MKRLLTSSKWGIVLISGAAAIIAALFDKVSMDKAFEVITILGGAAIGDGGGGRRCKGERHNEGAKDWRLTRQDGPLVRKTFTGKEGRGQ